MKLTQYIKFSALSLLMIGGLSSCKKDYLETAPTDQTSPSTVFSSIENAKGAINGLAKAMKAQYLGTQILGGESAIKMAYGNYSGNHFSSPLTGWSSLINLEYIANPQNTYIIFPWYYYYKIIGNANTILDNVDQIPGPQNEKDLIKAQALSYRAYCYMMLVQLYGDRWSDSENGTTSAVVLKTTGNTQDVALSSLAEAYDLIYSDLNSAIDAYTSSGIARASNRNYEMSVDVAYAIFARAALNKQDYANAEKYAQLARAKYPLMSVKDYKSGFSNPTSEWIWSIYDNDQETIYFFSFGAYIGYNSTASNVKNYPKSISKELFEKIPATDIRKSMFLNPEDAPEGTVFNKNTGQGDAKAYAYAKELYPSLQTGALTYSYMQFKIAINTAPGVAHVSNFRSSEMLLIEAEAKYFQNKPASEVQALLNELNQKSGRDTEYACRATGDALLTEIKTYRGIELWGEGYDFFDMKRWGDTIDRKSFDKGGNFQTILATKIAPNEKNKWKLVVPQRETDYNTLIQ